MANQEIRRRKASERLLESAELRVDRLRKSNAPPQKMATACNELQKSRSTTRKLTINLSKAEASKGSVSSDLKTAQDLLSQHMLEKKSEIKVS